MMDVTCAVILRDRLVLATRRSPGMPHPLRWEFPGGKVRQGETPEACVIREIGEELSIRVEAEEALDPVIRHDHDRSIRLLPFLCRMEGGEIELSEHQEYRWISCGELDSMDWLPADLGVVEQVRQRICP